jgi:hypothetical protein
MINQDRLTDLLKQQQEIPCVSILERLEILGNLQWQVRANLNLELALNIFSLQ